MKVGNRFAAADCSCQCASSLSRVRCWPLFVKGQISHFLFLRVQRSSCVQKCRPEFSQTHWCWFCVSTTFLYRGLYRGRLWANVYFCFNILNVYYFLSQMPNFVSSYKHSVGQIWKLFGAGRLIIILIKKKHYKINWVFVLRWPALFQSSPSLELSPKLKIWGRISIMSCVTGGSPVTSRIVQNLSCAIKTAN